MQKHLEHCLQHDKMNYLEDLRVLATSLLLLSMKYHFSKVAKKGFPVSFSL